MNYRHAYHAGNFADCVKHAILVWLLGELTEKAKPLLVLDTHAGIGHYDLNAVEAQKTGEAARGILKLQMRADEALAPYLKIVEKLGLYPGSPAISAAMLRANDRLIACELHPDDAALLRRYFAGDKQVAVHCRDGYEAIGAFLPPPEKRALTLIDPPFEVEDEFEKLTDAIKTAYRRLPGGCILAWYPIKHRAPLRSFYQALQDDAQRPQGLRDILAIEFLLREPLDPARLNGCGVILVNPPWKFTTHLPPLLSALMNGLGDNEPGQNFSIIRLADE
jgi:23S rRNA (adenine2030-N6)-methyltransferase